MANISSIQRDLKLKALYEAIEGLKKKSVGKKNYVTFEAVVDHANQSDYAKQFDHPIGISTIKQAKEALDKRKKESPFLQIKREIEKYKKEHNKIVKTTPNKLQTENKILTETVNNLMIQVAKIVDREMKKDEKIKNLQESLDKAKEERNHYFHQTVNGGK